MRVRIYCRGVFTWAVPVGLPRSLRDCEWFCQECGAKVQVVW